MKTVLGGGALGVATVLSPALSKRAEAVAQSLEELEADIMICKVGGRGVGDEAASKDTCCPLYIVLRRHDGTSQRRAPERYMRKCPPGSDRCPCQQDELTTIRTIKVTAVR